MPIRHAPNQEREAAVYRARDSTQGTTATARADNNFENEETVVEDKPRKVVLKLVKSSSRR